MGKIKKRIKNHQSTSIMKTPVKFKDYKAIQKAGSTLIIIAGVITLAKIFNLLNASYFIEEDLLNYLFFNWCIFNVVFYHTQKNK